MGKRIDGKKWVILFLAVVLSSSLFLSGGFCAEMSALKIAYVDVKQVFDSCAATQDATLSLKKELEAKKEILAREEEAILRQQRDLREKAAILSEGELEKQKKKIEDRMASLQKKLEADREELMKKEKELTTVIVEEIQVVIKELAKEKGYNLILEKSAVLYEEGLPDFTEEIIARVNAPQAAEKNESSVK